MAPLNCNVLINKILPVIELILSIICVTINLQLVHTPHRGEEGQPQQILVRATLSLFSRPSHLEILVLRLVCVLKFLILEDKLFFKNLAMLGLKNGWT